MAVGTLIVATSIIPGHTDEAIGSHTHSMNPSGQWFSEYDFTSCYLYNALAATHYSKQVTNVNLEGKRYSCCQGIHNLAYQYWRADVWLHKQPTAEKEKHCKYTPTRTIHAPLFVPTLLSNRQQYVRSL